MRKTRLLYLAALAAFAFVGVEVSAADLTTGLTQGVVSTITTRHNDEFSIVKAFKITSATTGPVRIDVPANTLAAPKLYLYGTDTSAGGISPSIVQSPLPLAVIPDGQSVSYTDPVSVTTALSDVTTAAKLASTTLDTSARRLDVSATGITSTETLDGRLEYRVPVKYRWYRQY